MTPGSLPFEWNFGDNDTSTFISPAHIYARVGKYIVTLYRFQNGNKLDSTFKTVYAYSKPGSVNFTGSDSAKVNDTLTYVTNTMAGIPVLWTVSLGKIEGSAIKDTVKVLWDTTGKETLTLEVGSGACANTLAKKITVYNPNVTTGIKLLNIGMKNIVISPNPNNGTFRLNFEGKSQEKITISITDVTGRKILSDNQIVADTHFEKLYTLPVNKGIYFLTVQGQDGSASAKIVIY